ncbi:MAG: acyl carrier protein [Boseongicola sp.]
MNRKDIEAEIRSSLTRLVDQDVSQVPSDKDLGEAIGLDSLGRLELLSEVEERFDLTIYEADSDEASTIGGMAKIVEAAIVQEMEPV